MREFFKNLPNTTTPLNAQRMNGFLNGNEAMGSIVVDDVSCKNRFNSELKKGVYLYADGTYSGAGSALTNYLCTKTFTKVTAGETIHISLNYASQQVGFVFYNDAGIFVSAVSTSTAIVPEGATKCHINIQKSSTATSIELSDIEWVQLEKGTVATEYTPHKNFDSNIYIVTGEEVATNEYIDGKRKYTKELYVSSMPTGSSTSMNLISLDDISYSKIWLDEGNSYISNASATIGINWFNSSTDFCRTFIQNKQIVFRCPADLSSYSGTFRICYLK
jgi:hypothetical protein